MPYPQLHQVLILLLLLLQWLERAAAAAEKGKPGKLWRGYRLRKRPHDPAALNYIFSNKRGAIARLCQGSGIALLLLCSSRCRCSLLK